MLSPALPPTLSLVLALVVGVGSLFCFSFGFVAPRLYRRQDLVWSGVGLFYALVLWFCAAQIRGAILLGTIANVALLGWLGFQVYLARWEQLTEVDKAKGTLKWLRIGGQKVAHFIESSAVTKPRSSQPATSSVRWVRSPKAAVEKAAHPEFNPVETNPVEVNPAETSGIITLPETPVSPVSLGESEVPVSIAPNPIAPLNPPADLPTDLPTDLPSAQPVESKESTLQSVQSTETSIVSPSSEILDPETSPEPSQETFQEISPAVATEADSSDEDWGDFAEAEEPVLSPATDAETTRLKAIVAQPLPKTGLLGRIQNFFQGRKSNGKRFVRPEDQSLEDQSPEHPEPSISSEPGLVSTPNNPTQIVPESSSSGSSVVAEFSEPIEPIADPDTIAPIESERSTSVSENAPENTPENTPETPEQVSPEETEQVLLEETEQVSPEETEQVLLEETEQVSPEQAEQVSPEQTEQVLPEQTEQVSPEQTEQVSEPPKDTGEMQQTGKITAISEIDETRTLGTIAPSLPQVSIVPDSQPEKLDPEPSELTNLANPIEGKMVPLFPATQATPFNKTSSETSGLSTESEKI